MLTSSSIICQEHLQHNIFIPPWPSKNVTLSRPGQRGLHQHLTNMVHFAILSFYVNNSEELWQYSILLVCLHKTHSFLFLHQSSCVMTLMQGLKCAIYSGNASFSPWDSVRCRLCCGQNQIQILVLLRQVSPALCSLQMGPGAAEILSYLLSPHTGGHR